MSLRYLLANMKQRPKQAEWTKHKPISPASGAKGKGAGAPGDLRQHFVDHLAVHVRQPAADAVVVKRQPLMVDSQ